MIREAQYFDAGDLFKLIRAMHEAGRYSKFTFDDETVMKFIMEVIDSKRYFCWVGVDKEGEIISAYIGGLEHFTFSKEYYASDYGAYTYVLYDLIFSVFKSVSSQTNQDSIHLR